MLKHVIVLLVLSLIVILASPYIETTHFARYLLMTYEWAMRMLSDVFSPGKVGLVLRQTIAIICLPIGVGIVPALLACLLRRHFCSIFFPIMWATWWLQLGVLLAAGSWSVS